MKQLRHFSELSRREVQLMWSKCCDAAINYAQEINMSGLSHGGSHNIYNALEDAIFGEWENAKKVHHTTKLKAAAEKILDQHNRTSWLTK